MRRKHGSSTSATRRACPGTGCRTRSDSWYASFCSWRSRRCARTPGDSGCPSAPPPAAPLALPATVTAAYPARKFHARTFTWPDHGSILKGEECSHSGVQADEHPTTGATKYTFTTVSHTSEGLGAGEHRLHREVLQFAPLVPPPLPKSMRPVYGMPSIAASSMRASSTSTPAGMSGKPTSRPPGNPPKPPARIPSQIDDIA